MTDEMSFEQRKYVNRRNSLIVRAIVFADRSSVDKRNIREGEKRTERWNRLYHGEMDRLTKEMGL